MNPDRDVIVLGAGIAGLTAAYRLASLDVEVLDAASHVGGRTLSFDYGPGVWANAAAQYLSADKVAVIDLADEIGIELVDNGFEDADLRGRSALDEGLTREIDRVIALIEAEQANRRLPTLPELDDRTFAEWLEPHSREVQQYFEHWCASLMCASSAQTSVYGALLLWGDQRTAAFTGEPVRRSNRGDTVINGGTHRLTRALAERSGATISLDREVLRSWKEGDVYHVQVRDAAGTRHTSARHLVVALPAPVASRVLEGLPADKREALASIRYGRFLSTPIRIAAKAEGPRPYPTTWSRPNQTYNSNNFVLKTPGDIDRDGGCFHSYVYDTYARQIWEDPDHTVKTGAVRALLDRFPQYEGRIREVEIARWRHGLPVYSPGRMKHQALLEASVDEMHFCGDYVLRSNTDGAVRSAEIAASRVLERNLARR